VIECCQWMETTKLQTERREFQERTAELNTPVGLPKCVALSRRINQAGNEVYE
jgi:hypothetical protein